MATKSEEVKTKKKRKSRVIPEIEIRRRIIQIYEVICPECKEIVKDSVESYQMLTGKYTCGICGEKFMAVVAQSKKDGRGIIKNKEIARNNILKKIDRSGPISAQRLGKNIELNSVATRKILDALEEENLIRYESKGWVLVE